MKRTQIYLDEGQDRELARLARSTGTTKSELIRRAIAIHERELGDSPHLAQNLNTLGNALQRQGDLEAAPQGGSVDGGDNGLAASGHAIERFGQECGEILVRRIDGQSTAAKPRKLSKLRALARRPRSSRSSS